MKAFIRIPRDDFERKNKEWDTYFKEEKRIKKKLLEEKDTNKKNILTAELIYLKKSLNPQLNLKGKNNRPRVFYLDDKERREIIKFGIESLTKYIYGAVRKEQRTKRFNERIKVIEGFSPTPPVSIADKRRLFDSHLFEIELSIDDLITIGNRIPALEDYIQDIIKRIKRSLSRKRE